MASHRSAGGRQDPPAPLVQALGAVSEWLDSSAVPGAIIGGVAASVPGRPRLTEDIDVLVILERQEWTPFLRAGREFGFAPASTMPSILQSRMTRPHCSAGAPHPVTDATHRRAFRYRPPIMDRVARP